MWVKEKKSNLTKMKNTEQHEGFVIETNRNLEKRVSPSFLKHRILFFLPGLASDSQTSPELCLLEPEKGRGQVPHSGGKRPRVPSVRCPELLASTPLALIHTL